MTGTYTAPRNRENVTWSERPDAERHILCPKDLKVHLSPTEPRGLTPEQSVLASRDGA